MPTYRNDTDRRITHSDMGYMEWQPGEEKSPAFFVPWERLGLTLVSPEPRVLGGDGARGFGYTEMIIGPDAALEDRRYGIPYSEAVEISVFVLEGWVRMFIGDSDIPVVVDRNNNHVGRYAWDMSAYLTFEADEGAAVYVKCEPYTMRGTEGRA